MHVVKNIAMIFCLLAAPEALGMVRKIKDLRDNNTIGIYTDTKMIKALKRNNTARIEALLQRAARHMRLFAKSPLGPEVINTAIKDADHNPIEILKLLLKNNAPIDANAVPYAIELNSTGLLEVGEIRNILELLLAHNAPLDTRALEKALEWNCDDYVELLLQHNAPVSDAAIDSACKNQKDTILILFVKYNHEHYVTILSKLGTTVYEIGILNKIVLYVDNKQLAYAAYHNFRGMDDFIRWFIKDNAALAKLGHESTTYYFASVILNMPNITLPYDYAQLLEKIDSEDVHDLMWFTIMDERDTNQKARASLLDFLLRTHDEMALKERYFHHITHREFLYSPMICVTVLSALRKKRMVENFKHKSMYNNVTFAFK